MTPAQEAPMTPSPRDREPRMVEVSEDVLRQLQRTFRAAKASVEAWDGMRDASRKLNVWDKPDEVIYQSPVQSELREAVRNG